MSTVIDATWVGPAGSQLNGIELVPGETVCQIGADEARDSANWAPVKPAPAPAPKTPSEE